MEQPQNPAETYTLATGAEFGPFRIVGLLGEGGMGAVYHAKELQSGRDVALKLPKVDAGSRNRIIGRFKREAGTVASIDHPGICKMYDFGDVNGQFYLSMGFVDGVTLSDVIKKKKITSKQIALLTRKLAVAIAAAHDQGIIHRDIKPGNVMITQKGEPVVMDFGLARMEDVDDTQLTKTGAFLGTPAYASPEQITNRKGEVDQRTDIYSLGVIMYRILARRLPYDASNTVNMIAQVLAADPDPPSEHNSHACPRLCEIAMRAMSRDIDRRYQTMYELASDLTAYLKGDTQPRENQETVLTYEDIEPDSDEEVLNTQQVDLLDLNLIDAASAARLQGQRKKKKKRKRKNEASRQKMMIGGSVGAGLLLLITLMSFLGGDPPKEADSDESSIAETTTTAPPETNEDPKDPTAVEESHQTGEDDIPADPVFAALLGKGDWQWSKPKQMQSFSGHINSLTVSSDGCTLVFSSWEREGGRGDADLWQCTRNDIDSAWSTPIPLNSINTAAVEWSPSISSDGLQLYYHGVTEENGGDIFVSQFNTTSADWSPGKLSDPVFNTSTTEQTPVISPNSLDLALHRFSIDRRSKYIATFHRNNSQEPFEVVSSKIAIAQGLAPIYCPYGFSNDSLQLLLRYENQGSPNEKRLPGGFAVVSRKSADLPWEDIQFISPFPEKIGHGSIASEAGVIIFQIGNELWEMHLEKKTDSPAAVTSHSESEEEKPSTEKLATRSSATQNLSYGGTEQLQGEIDLLSLIDLRDCVPTEGRPMGFDGEKLLIGGSPTINESYLEFPVELPVSYSLDLNIKRKSTTGGVSICIPYDGDSSLQIVIDGKGGTGIQAIDGLPYSANESTYKGGASFKDFDYHNLRIEVSPSSVNVFFDGDKLTSYSGSSKRVYSQQTYPNRNALFLYSFNHSLFEIKELTATTKSGFARKLLPTRIVSDEAMREASKIYGPAFKRLFDLLPPGKSPPRIRTSQMSQTQVLYIGSENVVDLTSSMMSEIVQLKGPVFLELYRMNPEEAATTLQHFEALGKMPNLVELDLWNRHFVDTPRLEALAKSKTLEHLVLDHQGMDEEEIRAVCQMKQLLKLRMDSVGMTDSKLQLILNSLHKLKHFSISHWGADQTISSKTIDMFNQLPDLDALHIANCPGVNDQLVPSLGKLKNLKVLNLKETAITESGYMQLKSMLPETKIEWSERTKK